MAFDVLVVLGAVGLFLFGMSVMTDALRTLAGDALRRLLARFTRRPWMGALSGTVATAVLQSSSAVTVAAVGFVGAGVIGFEQALGVVFGANLGTTVTGWLVVLLGFKLDLASAFYGVLFVGALVQMFGSGRVAMIGRCIAGLALVFVGIDLLQSGMSSLSVVLDPGRFPPSTLVGRLELVGLGIVATMITQSSSAGVALTIAAIHAGTLTLPQGAAVVIGMDIGTTGTAVLAAVGRTTNSRRTAGAHVTYNVIAGGIALVILDPALEGLAQLGFADPPMTLVAFHTTSNLLTLALLLPAAPHFARLIIRLVPERGRVLTRRLDRALLREPAVAHLAAVATAHELYARLFTLLARALRGSTKERDFAAALDEIEAALAETRDFIEQVQVPRRGPGSPPERVALLHVIDHLDRAAHRMRKTNQLETVRAVGPLRVEARRLGRRWLAARPRGLSEPELHELARTSEQDAARFRRVVFARSGRGVVQTDKALDQLDAARWLTRLVHHAWRITGYLTQAGGRDHSRLSGPRTEGHSGAAPKLKRSGSR